jgi:hypothetical protein
MSFRVKIPRTFDALRSETRIPMEVGVQVTGNGALPGTEATFTSNVSSRGARILSTRRWKINDRLTIATLTGSFRSVARVAYCQPEPQLSGFAVGVEFLDPKGSWVVTPPRAGAVLTR